MSSFDFTDNFSGFNDLINRADFLTEAKKSPYGKYHPSFGGVTKDLRSAGFSSAPLDTINFIRTTLYNLHLISHDELMASKKGAGFAGKKKNLLALLDAKEDIIEKNKDKIAKEIETGLATFIKRSAVDRGKEEKYAAQKAENETKEAARKLAKDIKAGIDVGDAVDDTVDDIGRAEKEAFERLQDAITRAGKEPTTMVEIKIADKDRVDDVAELVSQYANKDGVDIEGNTLTFLADPDSPLANAVINHGEDKVGAAIRRDVAKIADNAVAVMSPGAGFPRDEDYEVGVEPGGSPNEYEEDINDSEDEDNEFDDFDIGPQSDENVPDDYEEVLKAMVTKDKEELAKNMIEDEEDKDFDDEQRDQDPLRHSGDLKKLTYSVGSVGGQHGQIMHTDKTFDSLEDACNHAGVDVQDCISGEWDDMGDGTKEYVVDEDTVIIMHVDKAEDEERINEAIKMQPHLEVSKTSTAVYLTEQKQSDKRNKKAEVKNQSFKERYKPKTHWQLEELRRYGL